MASFRRPRISSPFVIRAPSWGLARGLAVASLAATLVLPRPARAGGFEFPDNGTQGLGRGGAFTAKADDPTAVHYNVAGLARQRGTRILVNGNLSIQDYEFQRAGVYPATADGSEDAVTPWAGLKFPRVRNTGGPFFAPLLAITSDFGIFDRLTFAIAAYGPSAIGNRTFPLGVQGAPSPARYDFIQSRSLILLPTVAAAYRLTDWLDVGVGVHYVIGSFNQTTVGFADLGPATCKTAEYQPCDTRNRLEASGSTVTGSIGALVRPSANVAFGFNVRMPYTIEAEGTFFAQQPALLPEPRDLEPAAAKLTLAQPWFVRAGIRYIGMEKTFEVWDAELDATYETWGSAQGDGPRVQVPQLKAPTGNQAIDTIIQHKYNDTFSIRAGGAYNFEELGGVISFRAGAYYDASATAFPYTRLDFDTLSKAAGTLGVGYKLGGFTFNLGYAAVFSLPRTVADGLLRPVNGLKGGQPVGADDKFLPVVNNGDYSGFANIISFGLQVNVEELFGPPRHVEFGAEYEDHGGPVEPPKKEGEAEGDKKDGEKKDEKAAEKADEKKDVKPAEKADEKKGDPKRVAPASGRDEDGLTPEERARFEKEREAQRRTPPKAAAPAVADEPAEPAAAAEPPAKPGKPAKPPPKPAPKRKPPAKPKGPAGGTQLEF